MFSFGFIPKDSGFFVRICLLESFGSFILNSKRLAVPIFSSITQKCCFAVPCSPCVALSVKSQHLR